MSGLDLNCVVHNSSVVLQHEIAIEIGNVPILLRTVDENFRDLLASHYAGFIANPTNPQIEFDVDVAKINEEIPDTDDNDVKVSITDGEWCFRRSDFVARWDPRQRHGRVRQPATPYSVDAFLRIMHTLILAQQGGFLLHAASAVRNGRAFIFSGVSGAGKTTISRLAPPDVRLLTDEISYIRREGEDYVACGTPFSGELERPGTNCVSPIHSVFLLAKGTENRIDPLPASEALRCLLRNILFFAEDTDLVNGVFRSAWHFVQKVSVRRLTFLPDDRVWSMIA
ncbi:MAG: hypothetical protein DMG88_19405 [Acidobacteria bacterium]|nr:MAG: hypothetical protein DMG88_19405 [Acidobacteriota bacterium]